MHPVRLLGPLEVDGPLGTLRLSGARQRALLALLALRAPEVLSRSHLIDALWGAAPPPTAIKTLHSHIARVRQALAGIGFHDVLATREPGYVLGLAARDLDVAGFEEHVQYGRAALRAGDPVAAAEHLRTGLALWRGDPLADCPVAEWGRAEVARLTEARASAAESLAEAELAIGQHAAVAAELERLVVRYPLRERLWELLIIAHYRGGRQGEALHAYRRARAVLAEELGVEPGPGLRRLEAAVLAGAAELDPATAPVRPAPPARQTARPPVTEAVKQPAALPAATTSLVGRQRELSDVLRLLTESRLVTLTGPGGCGKTRLALRAGSELASNRAVTLVDLTSVADPELVADAVATAIGVAERPGADRTNTVVDALAERDLLVLLDNCEHLARACADLAGRLLAGCPRLTILATSREALRVGGETAYEVPPLAVPDPTVPRTLAELVAYDSVRLFLDRAEDNGAPVSGEDATAVAQLCAALDGLPLAIELAAARTTVLAPAQIVRRLRDRFGLLSYGTRTAAPHHRALRAAVAWSHDLLTKREAALFARLGVFAGGWSVEAAEAVADDDQTLDTLSALVAKSLVRVHRQAEVTRFFMLETIAAFAVEQQRADPAAEADVRARHAGYFLGLAEAANADPSGELLGRLRVEHDNLRAAMSWFASAPDGTDELRLAAALRRYCHLHGHYREGRQWLAHALARSPSTPSPALVTALAGAASLALFECDYPEVTRYATAGLRMAEELGDHAMIGRLLRLLGSSARERADYPEALRLYRVSQNSLKTGADPFGLAYSGVQLGATAWLSGDLDGAEQALTTSLSQLRALDDQEGIASSLAYLGAVALYRGRLPRARDLLEEALETFGKLEFKEGIAWAINLLGLLEHVAGQPAKAAPLLETSLALHRDLGDRWRQASILEAMAAVACATAETERAAALLRQAEEIREAIGAPVPAIERPALTATRAAVLFTH